MQEHKDFHINLLESEYLKRKRFNSQYSKRAFAKYLDINSGTLNSILNGDRKIPISSLKNIIEKLELTPTKAERLIQSQQLRGRRLKKMTEEFSESFSKKLIDDSSDNGYHILAHWEHYAILSLIDTDDFISDHNWIAKRLRLKIQLVAQALERLENENLISTDESGKYYCTYSRINTPQGITSKALQIAHHEELELAKANMNSCTVDKRHYASETMAIDPENMEHAHKLINEFREKMKELMSTEKKKEVYLLAIQLFPLTNMNTENQEIEQ